MTDKQEVIINNINLDDVKKLLYTGQRTAITTATFEKIIELLEEKTAECEELKKEKQDYCLNCDVAERMRKVVHAATGGRLSYANYTIDAIEQAYHDQLEIDVEYRTKGLKEENTKLQHKLQIATEALKAIQNNCKNVDV